MKKLLLTTIALASSLSLTAADRTASINIDSQTKFQHVTGFGGFSPSPQWQYWLNDSQMTKLFGKGETQLGLNILRLYIANNKNGWGSSVANAKVAKKYGAYVFASPWSPPASWKSNNSDSNGGYLLEWLVIKASSGMNEALVGNICLVRHEAGNDIVVLPAEENAHGPIREIYDLQGRPLQQLQPGINLVKYADGTSARILK